MVLSLSADIQQRVENTYHLEPDPCERFRSGRAEELVRTRLSEALQDVQYEAGQARSLAVSIADNIRQDLEQMVLPRWVSRFSSMVNMVFSGIVLVKK